MPALHSVGPYQKVYALDLLRDIEMPRAVLHAYAVDTASAVFIGVGKIHFQFVYRPEFLSEMIIIELPEARMYLVAVRTYAFLAPVAAERFK